MNDDTPRTDAAWDSGSKAEVYRVMCEMERDAEELANALRDALAGHPVRNADELIARYSPLPARPAQGDSK